MPPVMGRGNYLQVPGSSGGTPPAQSNMYRQQTEANTQIKQNQLNDDYERGMRMQAQQSALNRQNQMLADPNSRVSTNGMQMNVDNYGGAGGPGSAGSRSGVAIGGGIYPDLSNLMTSLQRSYKDSNPEYQKVGAPQVPQNSGMFAHAKDVSGRVGNKAIEALRNSMTQRGISDSGLAAVGEANILGNVARQQSDAEYNQAQLNTGRQWEANQMAYQGDINQNTMQYQTALNQKNQNLQAILQLAQLLY